MWVLGDLVLFERMCYSRDMEPARRIQFSVKEISEWKESQFVDFFRFASIFTTTRDDAPGTKYVFNKTVVELANSYLDTDEEPHFKEIARRINETDPKKYFLHLSKMVYAVCGFLKRNPAFVTENVEAQMKGNSKFEWALRHYKEMQTDAGGTTISPDSTQRAMRLAPQIRGREVEIMLMEAQLKIIDIYWHLAKSISRKDIQDLSTKDKLTYIKEIAPILKQNRIIKPTNVNIFNASKDSVEELEKSLLDYATKKT